MSLAESLLASIARADGDVLVMHVGEKAYVLAPSGRAELSSRALSVDQVSTMLAQLLPEDQMGTLADLGAVEYDLPSRPLDSDRFRLVAARGGDDIWVEIRRQRLPRPESVGHEPPPVEPAPPPAPSPLAAATGPQTEAAAPEPQPAVVLPLQRSPVRAASELDKAEGLPEPARADRLLRLASARGASTLYLVAHVEPLVRVDGEVVALTGERPLEAAEVETILLDLAPEPTREALRSGAVTEWLADAPDGSRVRCLSFSDQRGPGGILRLIPAEPLAADHLGLSRQIQALCDHSEGLVVVTGPRGSGKSTLLSAFVDLINRSRGDHIITLEHQLKFVHRSQRSFVSQREVRGDGQGLAAATRAALREDPDVLVLGELATPEIVTLALEAAESGRLVLGVQTSSSATAVVERLIERFPPDEHVRVRQALALTLRGTVGQVLLRKARGGRLAARELLLNTPAVARLISEGKTFQLPLAVDSGRKHGMVPLNDALVAFVRSGAVDPREAYRVAPDRESLLSLLARAGIDTSFVERLA